MYISKFRVALVVIVLSAILSVGSVTALLKAYYTIPSSGLIGLLVDRPSVARAQSEIRAVFFKVNSMVPSPDWDTVMATLESYNMNVLIGEFFGNNRVMYPGSNVVDSWSVDEVGNAITAGHAHGIKVYGSMNVMLSSPGAEYQMEDQNGAKIDALDPTKPITKSHMKALVEEIVTRYDIDGFMFDYARYPYQGVSYSPESRVAFEVYLGETITDWTQFYPGGARENDFLEWRNIPVNELVRDMRNWMLAIRPNMEFTASPLGWFGGSEIYSSYWYGQDAAAWIKEGSLDWVAPQEYAEDTTTIHDRFVAMVDSGVGGPEGKIPMVGFITYFYPHAVEPGNTRYATDFLKRAIDVIRQIGLDGFCIYSYGGPGNNAGFPGDTSGQIDIRPYLNLVNLSPTFGLTNINVQTTDPVVISWTTDNPATSKVEYSVSPLFTWSLVPSTGGLSALMPTHQIGDITEDISQVMNHSMTLTGLHSNTEYYFRVQSEDESGIATSKVYTFEL